MDLTKIKKIYMIGIKGVGMTMLAQFLDAKGIWITGSDTNEVFMTDEVLENAEIEFFEGFSIKNIPRDADLIIYSGAYNKDNNVEVAHVIGGGKKVLSYAEALGEVFNQAYGIAVTGSHGKTTTTAWLGYVMREAGVGPSVMVGSKVPQFHGASIVGSSNYLVVEADEYQNKLKYLAPKAVLLNNIDYDHPDFFPTNEVYIQVFVDFIKKIPKKGFLVANFDDETIRKIVKVNTVCNVITYGAKEGADYIAYDIRQNNGKQYFKVRLADGDELGEFAISLYGKHSVSNAMAVIASSIEFGIELLDIRKYLEDFKGTARRMEVLGKYKGAVLIDDYAHHPTEIKTTLKGVREMYKDKKLRVIFHPHTFTRTKALLNDFCESFHDADEVAVLDIYGSAREEQGGVHSRDLVDKIKESIPAHLGKHEKCCKKAYYISTIEEAAEYLKKTAGRDDIIILMGAGDVFRVGDILLGE